MAGKIKIEKLSYDNLQEASTLADRIFINDISAYDPSVPSQSFEASLSKKVDINSWQGKATFALYFVARDGARVVGVCGLYELEKDGSEADWLGWFCVDESCRNKGVGSRLLDCAIKTAKKRGKKFLRLYTSTLRDEAAAQVLYVEKGFHICKDGLFKKAGEYRLFQRELDLP
jgi:GNAT superfamily N-acetyltransferase